MTYETRARLRYRAHAEQWAPRSRYASHLRRDERLDGMVVRQSRRPSHRRLVLPERVVP